MSSALITGGLGLIGSFIARELLDQGVVDRVVCLDHFGRYTNSISPDFIDYRRARIRGYEDRIVIERGEAKYANVLLNTLNRHRPDYVFHLAALPLAKIGNLNTQEAMDGTVTSTSAMLEIIDFLKREHAYRPRRFVYASSSMIYGDFVEDPIPETAPAAPISIYGTMKLAGEIVTRGLGRTFGIPYSIVRPSAVYGPTDMNRRVSQIFVENALRGESLVVNGADEKLDFTYVTDIAHGFVLAATHPAAEGETFNITCGQSRTLLEFVEVLKHLIPELSYEVRHRDETTPHRGTLSIEKARRMLGYEPRYPLEKGLEVYVEFVKNMMSGLTDQIPSR